MRAPLFQGANRISGAPWGRKAPPGPTRRAPQISLSNPVASLISVPFQFNYDARIGPERDGDKFYLSSQAVVPIPLDKDWSTISRTILPVVSTGAHDFGARAVVTFLFPTQAK